MPRFFARSALRLLDLVDQTLDHNVRNTTDSKRDSDRPARQHRQYLWHQFDRNDCQDDAGCRMQCFVQPFVWRAREFGYQATSQISNSR